MHFIRVSPACSWVIPITLKWNFSQAHTNTHTYTHAHTSLSLFLANKHDSLHLAEDKVLPTVGHLWLPSGKGGVSRGLRENTPPPPSPRTFQNNLKDSLKKILIHFKDKAE